MFETYRMKKEIQRKIEKLEKPRKSTQTCKNCKHSRTHNDSYYGRMCICKLGAQRLNDVIHEDTVNKCNYYKNKYGYEVKK